jgi:hypothetical protein
VYVATNNPQSVTQCRATVRTADEKAAVTRESTVDLKLMAVRQLSGVQFLPNPTINTLLRSVAVLSPYTLLLSHKGRTLSVLTHTARGAAGQTVGADSKLDGAVSLLRELDPQHSSREYTTGMAVDTERRRIFAGECMGGRVVVYDADSGLQIAVPSEDKIKHWGSATAVAVIDDVLVISNGVSGCLHFKAVDSITGLGMK